MPPPTFAEAFPDPQNAVCRAFFQQPESSAKNWRSFAILSTSDDVTFWTVVANHSKLPHVVDMAARAVDESHATSSRQHRVAAEDQNSFVAFLLRLMTTLPMTPPPQRLLMDVETVASRMNHVLPTSVLFPVTLILMRVNGHHACLSLASFLITCPIPLSQLSGATSMWYDSVAAIASRCVIEAKRGRFQRKSGDVLPLLERAYRLTKHIWALLHAAPYLANYMDVKKVISGLRIVCDIISPIIQHFLLSCDTLQPRRQQLSRANAMLLNAGISATTTLLLFLSYQSLRSSKMEKKFLNPNTIAAFDQLLYREMTQKCRTLIVKLLEKTGKSMFKLAAELHPVPAREGELKNPSTTSAAVGEGAAGAGAGKQNPESLFSVLSILSAAIPNSKDFEEGLIHGKERFAVLILIELVQHGLHVDRLVDSGFLTVEEGYKLGSIHADPMTAAGDEVPHAGATTSAAPNKATPSGATATDDPEAAMVLSVLPHLSVPVVLEAIQYFNHDIETLIMEFVSGNIPPHLNEMIQEEAAFGRNPTAAAASQQSPPKTAADVPPPTAATVNLPELDQALMQADMEAFLTGDYMEDATVLADRELDDEGMRTFHRDSTMSELLYEDGGFKEQQLELLYDDERDDGEDGEKHAWGAQQGGASSSDEDEAPLPEGNLNRGGSASGNQSSGNNNADLRRVAGRTKANWSEKDRKKALHSKAAAAAEKLPYEQKKKVRKETKVTSASLSKAVKRGGFE